MAQQPHQRGVRRFEMPEFSPNIFTILCFDKNKSYINANVSQRPWDKLFCRIWLIWRSFVCRISITNTLFIESWSCLDNRFLCVNSEFFRQSHTFAISHGVYFQCNSISNSEKYLLHMVNGFLAIRFIWFFGFFFFFFEWWRSYRLIPFRPDLTWQTIFYYTIIFFTDSRIFLHFTWNTLQIILFTIFERKK